MLPTPKTCAELGAARLLATEAIEAGQTGLANMILTTIAKLSHSQIAGKKAKSEYLERRVVYQLVQELVNILARAVEGKFDGWELALDQAANEMTGAVAAASNAKQLEGKSHE